MTDLFSDVEERPRSARTRAAPWLKRVVLTLFAVFVIFALTGGIGQQPDRSTASGPRARLVLEAPDTIRGGLLVQARLEIHALNTIAAPQLVLQRGWFEGMQINSIEPSPSAETGRGTDVSLAFTAMRAGETRTIWFQLQVDPTTVGHRPADIVLQDGSTPLARISHQVTVLP